MTDWEGRDGLWAKIRHLEEVGDVDALVEEIHHPPPAHATSARSGAAQALGRLEAEQVVPALIELLDNADEEVRAGAALALGRIGGRDALAAVAGSVADRHPRVQGVALWELRLRDDERAAPAARTMIRHESRTVRTAAVLTLAELGRREDIALLRETMREVRWSERPFYRKAIRAIERRLA